jgi:hypothetical protein
MEKHCEHITKIEEDYLKREFEGSEILPAHILQLNNPYKLFSHFLSQDFLIRIVRETCIHSTQIQPNKPITTSPNEIEKFLGILLWMSIIRQPNTRRYWSPQTRVSKVADVMPVNRFEKIKRCLHFSNNLENDRNIDKILPLIH